MATSVGELEATLRLRDELSSRLKEVDANLAKSGQNFEAVGGKAKTFGTTTDNLVGSLMKAGAALGVVFSAGALVGAIRNVVKLGDEISDLSALTGIGIVELQKLGAVAELNGASMAELAKGVQAMSRNIVGDDKAAANAVKLLGLNLEDLKGMNPDEIFLEVADAAGKIESPMERNRILFDLGGKALEKLAPTVANVADEMEHAAGVMDEKTVKSLAAANDQIANFGRTWDAFLAKMGTPALAAALAGLDALIQKFMALDAARVKAAAGDMGAAGTSPLAAGEALGAKLKPQVDAYRQSWADLITTWNASKGPLDFLNTALKVQEPTLRSTSLATVDTTTATRALSPAVREAADEFDRAKIMIDSYREEAAFPLTEAHKNLIIQLDDMGVSLSEIATLTKAPETAVRLYLKSIEDADKGHKAFIVSSDALEKSLDNLDVTFRKLAQAETFAQLMQKNTAVLNEFKTRVTEFELLPADQIGQVTAADQAFTKLQATLNAVGLEQTTMGSSAETAALKSAAAWREYNNEILQIESGMGAAVTATDGMTAATGRLSTAFEGASQAVQRFQVNQNALKIPVPADFDWSKAYSDAGIFVRGGDISGGWSSRAREAELSRQNATRAAAMAPYQPGTPIYGVSGAGWGGTQAAVNVNINAQNSLYLPSNQQDLGQIVSQAVIAQLKAQGVKVGGA